MKLKHVLSLCLVLAAAPLSFGQSATLVADQPTVPGGASVVLTASVAYGNAPAALGWSITLPEGWTYVATSGPDLPAVTPQAGSTGTLEWAYTDAPTNAASFRFTLKAPAKAGAAPLKAKVLLRADGKQQTIEVAPVMVAVAS